LSVIAQVFKRQDCNAFLRNRREGDDDFFEARVAAQRVPPWHQFQVAITDAARKPGGAGKLLAGKIVLADPGSDSSEADDHSRAAACIFFHGKKLNTAPAFAQSCLLSPKTGVD